MNTNQKSEKGDFISYLKQQWDAFSMNPGKEDVPARERIWRNVSLSIRENRRRSVVVRWSTAVAVAASLVLVALAGYALWQHNESVLTDKEYVWIASNGNVQTLPDGTKVWMEKGSRMRFNENFLDDRQVWLEGNSTFEVTKRDGRNFKVNLKDSYVEVKGTCFSVKQDTPENIAVTLYNGKVDFVSTRTENVVTLKPSQKIVYNTSDDSILVSETSRNICWCEGSYKMDAVSLDQLTEFLTWRYNVTFDSSDVLRSGKTLTGIIGYDESLKTVLDKICYVFDIRYVAEGELYRLID
ncbi:MAG: FecR family protein [Bacteroidales bacterium]|nr:FecR family protein [Bacteroidales bacterium]